MCSGARSWSALREKPSLPAAVRLPAKSAPLFLPCPNAGPFAPRERRIPAFEQRRENRSRSSAFPFPPVPGPVRTATMVFAPAHPQQRWQNVPLGCCGSRKKGQHPGTGGGAPQGIACKPSYPGFRAKGGCNRGNRLFRQSPCVCRIAGPLRPGHGSAYKPGPRPARRHPLAARNRPCGAVPARLPGRGRRAGPRPARLRPKRPAVPFHAVAPGHGEPAAFRKGATPSRQSCVAPASAGPCRRGCPRPLAPGISWR